MDGRVNLKVRGVNLNVGAVGIEIPKFEAKKGDFAKIWQKLEGLQPPRLCRLGKNMRTPPPVLHQSKKYYRVKLEHQFELL